MQPKEDAAGGSAAPAPVRGRPRLNPDEGGGGVKRRAGIFTKDRKLGCGCRTGSFSVWQCMKHYLVSAQQQVTFCLTLYILLFVCYRVSHRNAAAPDNLNWLPFCAIL